MSVSMSALDLPATTVRHLLTMSITLGTCEEKCSGGLTTCSLVSRQRKLHTDLGSRVPSVSHGTVPQLAFPGSANTVWACWWSCVPSWSPSSPVSHKQRMSDHAVDCLGLHSRSWRRASFPSLCRVRGGWLSCYSGLVHARAISARYQRSWCTSWSSPLRRLGPGVSAG